jgi:outer membrane protein assembly factor BamB
MSKHSWRLYALDKHTGKIIWERIAYEGGPRSKRHPKNTYASSTSVTDGKYVVAFFGSEGLYVYDFNGKFLWKKDLGILNAGWFRDSSFEWGVASSPIIYEHLVIIQCDIQGNSFVAAFRLKDGKLAWRTPRNEISSWGTPTVYQDARHVELITHAPNYIRAYDPRTGKELWRLSGNSKITTPTPITAHGLIYVTNGYREIQPIYAIRPGGRGDISLRDGATSNEFVAWSKRQGGPYTPTPVVYGDYLYTCSNNGVLTAYDAKTGEKIYRQRIAGKGSAYSASPIASDGKLYFTSEDGEIHVVRAGRRYDLLASNPMGEILMATPAISEGIILIRGLEHLFAIGKRSAPESKQPPGVPPALTCLRARTRMATPTQANPLTSLA